MKKLSAENKLIIQNFVILIIVWVFLKLYNLGYRLPFPWITSIRSLIISMIVATIVIVLLFYKLYYPLLREISSGENEKQIK